MAYRQSRNLQLYSPTYKRDSSYSFPSPTLILPEPDYYVHEFACGLRLVHKQVTHSRIAHLGYVLDVGSRDEAAGEQGLAHFWEHMAFKGTQKRKAFHILNRLETVGGELNAYTTKEKIVFYASLLDDHYKMAAELLTDITFRSTFPVREIEKERQVILEEMAMYYDTPDDAIFDDLDTAVFGGHPLGVNILGTADTVRGFTQSDFEGFYRRNVSIDRLVLASVANMPLAKVVKILQPLVEGLEQIVPPNARPERLGVVANPPERQTVPRPISQAHAAWGCPAPSLADAHRLPFFMLVNILGGPGANSRLNMALRERYGFVYGVDASYTPYLDTGMFSIYFATDTTHLARAGQLVERELRTLREKPLGTSQLHMAKEQLMGQLAMAEESNSGMMQVLGKSILDTGYVETLSDIFAQIRSTTASQLQELAEVYLQPEAMHQLVYKPS
jgi:predicted Zn-dependent peptidase